MAGLNTTFTTKSLISRPHSLSSSFFSSNLFTQHIYNPTSFKILISRSRLFVSARYGGGGGAFSGLSGLSSGSYQRSPRSNSDEDDDALDLSTIRSDTVRLIDQRQNMVGIVPKAEALRMAEEAELDLVLLSPDADPPVVKLLDYSKYKYEQQKKKREQQKKATVHRMDLKELKMGYNIDVHDYAVRLKAALKFLKAGDKVKVLVTLKGREKDFKKNAIELLKRFQTDIGELATEESRSFRDRSMTLVMVPNKNYKEQELPKKKEDSIPTEDSISSKEIPVQNSQDSPTKTEDSVPSEQVSAPV
jgi:translation initiation factor IF-3